MQLHIPSMLSLFSTRDSSSVFSPSSSSTCTPSRAFPNTPFSILEEQKEKALKLWWLEPNRFSKTEIIKETEKQSSVENTNFIHGRKAVIKTNIIKAVKALQERKKHTLHPTTQKAPMTCQKNKINNMYLLYHRAKISPKLHIYPYFLVCFKTFWQDLWPIRMTYKIRKLTRTEIKWTI